MPDPEPMTKEAGTPTTEAVRELTWIVPRAPTLTEGQVSTRLRWPLFRLATRVGMPVHALGREVGLLSIHHLQRRAADLLQPKVP